MKRKVFLLVLSAAAALGLCFGLAACGETGETPEAGTGETHLLLKRGRATP